VSALGRLFRTPWAIAAVGGALLMNAVLATRVAGTSTSTSVLFASLPLAAVIVGALAVSRREVLVYATFGSNMAFAFVTGATAGHLYVADVIAALALASWAVARMLGGENAHGSRAAPVGWPLVIFSVAMLQAVIRGHYAYGLQYLSGPTRILFYASIALALTDADPRRLYRGIMWTFYVGTTIQFFTAIFYVATGRSQTNQTDLSTGGFRYVSLTVAIFMSCALFMALLSLQVDKQAGRRLLHLVVAGMAVFVIILAFGRSTYIALGIVLPLLLIASPSVRNSLLAVIPLCLPFAALVALLLPGMVPDLGHNFVDRITISPTNDINVRWRAAASHAVLDLAKQSPITGVGFGTQVDFVFDYKQNGVPIRTQQVVDQDPHDGYLYLLSGGGIVALGSFLLVIAAFARQWWQALRVPLGPEERVLVMWAALSLLTFLANIASGQVLHTPGAVLTIWTLLALPSTVLRRERHEAAPIAPPLRAINAGA
jgi:O-antigen ligase